LWRGAHRKWNRRPPEYWTPPNRGNVEEHVAVDQDIYAEVSIRFERIEELEEALPPADFVRLPLPWEAAFLAGKCFVRYTAARRAEIPAAGLLHRCACGSCRSGPVHPRSVALPHVLPGCGDHRPIGARRSQLELASIGVVFESGRTRPEYI
jgi:hypothetical protein